MAETVYSGSVEPDRVNTREGNKLELSFSIVLSDNQQTSSLN